LRQNDKEILEHAIALVSQSSRIVAFTGAGMSVESGIPDFRSKGGLWEKFKPEVYASYDNFMKDPHDFWELIVEMDKVLLPAKPNKGHLALAELETMGKLDAIITQNIDGLHQEAGNTKVYELHGTSKTASCIQCHEPQDLKAIQQVITQKTVPTCTKCGSERVKVDVILFGESLPEGIFDKAFKSISDSDLLIVIGSSLQVSPANLIPSLAKKAGAKLLIINKEPTSADSAADVVLHWKVGIVLPAIL